MTKNEETARQIVKDNFGRADWHKRGTEAIAAALDAKDAEIAAAEHRGFVRGVENRIEGRDAGLEDAAMLVSVRPNRLLRMTLAESQKRGRGVMSEIAEEIRALKGAPKASKP